MKPSFVIAFTLGLAALWIGLRAFERAMVFVPSRAMVAHPGTVGKVILGELQILDDDGNPQTQGTPGTVWFKGATAFEYYNAPEKTAESRNAAGDTSTVNRRSKS